MSREYLLRCFVASLVLASALLLPAERSEAILGLFEDKVVTEEERQETEERIREVQEKLRLLQEKLRVLEQRQAAGESGEAAVGRQEPGEANWQEVNEALVDPGDFGVYTYVLFAGDPGRTEALGALEDLILTIETLPGSDVPAKFRNRFLVPLEQPLSSVELGRQPYDFTLSRAYLSRFGIDAGGQALVLVSSTKPVDPYAETELPPHLAVRPGARSAISLQALLRGWHDHEQIPSNVGIHPLGDLFLALLDGAGPTEVERTGQRLVIDFSPE